ncbi:MAG TPA: hypothetical protein DD391_02335 [Clostridiales bacterium]|nr:XRE family transcriptional regulator [Clostridiales bacterium]HBL81430.1 hypothetical protein [Clostridiales bacterium]
MNFSQRLQEIMKNNGITKFKLSKQLNVSPSTVANWLNGESRPNIERIRQIAEFFNVSADFLLTGNNASSQQMPVSNESFEQLERILLDAFRKVSISDKIAILQHAESLAHSRQIYDMIGDVPHNENFSFAENGNHTKSLLTPDDVRRIKALLKKYDEDNQ